MGVILYRVRSCYKRECKPPYDDMNPDVRKSSVVWPVFRREARGPGHPRAIYHYMGVGVASGKKCAEEMAVALCRDETYFIFPSPINVALPERIFNPKGLYFPLKKDPTHDLRVNVMTEGQARAASKKAEARRRKKQTPKRAAKKR